jgi:hypothetical protein
MCIDGNDAKLLLNGLPDCLSRFQMDRFKKLAPMADQTPSDIPAEFWSMISKLK